MRWSSWPRGSEGRGVAARRAGKLGAREPNGQVATDRTRGARGGRAGECGAPERNGCRSQDEFVACNSTTRAHAGDVRCDPSTQPPWSAEFAGRPRAIGN
jgi:hypothetical protein